MGRRFDEIKRLRDECLARLGGDQLASFVRQLGYETKRAGAEYRIVCPFHADHDPSMCIVPAKGLIHCFPCGWSGDAFTFAGELYGKHDFPDQVRLVAGMLGLAATDGKTAKVDIERVEIVKEETIPYMTAGEVLEEWDWYRERAYPHKEWAERLRIDPRMMDIAGMVAAPYRHDAGRRVLVAPMRDGEGTLCSLRFRCFETKARWSLDQKEKRGNRRVRVKQSRSGLISYEAVFDRDVFRGDSMDLVIEGETDLLGGGSILLREFGTDPIEWPLQIIALPGVMSCHAALLQMPLSKTVITFFDNDAAGNRAAFWHHRQKKIVGEDGKDQYVDNLEAPKQPGLIQKIIDSGRVARAAFPPSRPDGSKYDLRDMAGDGWTYSQLRSHLLRNATSDPHGRRLPGARS